MELPIEIAGIFHWQRQPRKLGLFRTSIIFRRGLFVDRAEALRFARFENGHRPETVIMVSGIFELDMSGKAIIEHPLAIPADAPRERRVDR